jgi:catechol 2,3-dioxygenase-like lactoylglutathione lyase family enzyme
VRPICVDHLKLPVGDLERSVAFYRAALVEGMGWSEYDAEGAPSFEPEGAEDLILDVGGRCGRRSRPAPAVLAGLPRRLPPRP